MSPSDCVCVCGGGIVSRLSLGARYVYVPNCRRNLIPCSRQQRQRGEGRYQTMYRKCVRSSPKATQTARNCGVVERGRENGIGRKRKEIKWRGCEEQGEVEGRGSNLISCSYSWVAWCAASHEMTMMMTAKVACQFALPTIDCSDAWLDG